MQGRHVHNWETVEEKVFRIASTKEVHSIRIVKYCYGCKKIEEEEIINNKN
jgi:hypothetical protein